MATGAFRPDTSSHGDEALADVSASFDANLVALLPSVVAKLGGAGGLGRRVRSERDLARMVEDGLPAAALTAAVAAGLTPADLDLIAPARTRRHRVANELPLSADESDGLIRLLRLQTLAEDVFGSPEKAGRWLHAPHMLLEGATPIATARTETGGRIVEDLIASIRWGAAV